MSTTLPPTSSRKQGWRLQLAQGNNKGMKTVRDACQLQLNALSIKLSAQIEQLDELITAEGNGAAFFEKTHITQGMQDLISEGVARLAGASTQAVFHLKQAMGGGKTHLLVGFGLLAKHQELRDKYCVGIAHASAFQSAHIAAFNGRNNPDHFFWGEIANQLGKAEQCKAFWTSGPKAPDEKDWLKLFEGGAPILILLDEMPPYFHYLDTQKVGNGTVADIATRAFANLLTAAGKKSNVCVVVSDLAAAYDTGARLINRALEDARSELGRQERNITPVDLAANEIYDILRKRLFKSLPDRAEIGDIAKAFGRKLEEAAKSKTANRGAEAIADEIAATYPFHPRLKNIIALFKENEQFKQTRGLIELVSRLLKSVWERPNNDVFLIGPQHFDLSIQEVRDKLTEISGMRDVIAKDLWDAQLSSHAQVIDLHTGKAAATQLGSLLLTASLSTAVNAVKGLTREEVVECLVSPLREPSDFLAAFEELEKVAWYLHHTPEGRYYFDRQENLTKLLQSLAHDAPENQVDDLIRHRLREMFKPARKTVYEDVLPLPGLEEVADRVRRGRVLLVVSPDSKIPPEDVQRFFEGLSQKNNLCVLTGDKTAMGSVEKAARQLFAAQKADGRIPKGHPQRDDLERKQQTYEHDFTSTILNLFDKVLFPIQRAGRPPQLASKALDMTRDATKPFNGEEQIEKTLVANPLKLYLDVEKEFDPIHDKAQDLLWPENQYEARWSDVADRYAEQAGMPWLPPKGLDALKSIACNRGLWEDSATATSPRNRKKADLSSGHRRVRAQ
jgi:Predicted ATPase (AAA+ superfamily)